MVGDKAGIDSLVCAGNAFKKENLIKKLKKFKETCKVICGFV